LEVSLENRDSKCHKFTTNPLQEDVKSDKITIKGIYVRGENIMETIIGLIIIAIIYFACKASTEAKVNAKNPLDVDNSKMSRDIANGVSQSEIRRRYGNGYYDKNR
jgi:hypothetical protein